PLEGTHTKIKTLKRNCFGMKNFNLFRKRIMLSCK
ncbi:transposase, partial [Peptoniphilus sp.]